MEKSESLIAVLLVIAIVLSIASIVIANNKVITGRDIAIGQVNLSVNTTASFTLTNASMDFGNLNLGASEDSTDDSPKPFTIKNTGSVNLDFTIQSGKNASTFIGGTSAGGPGPKYDYSSDCYTAGCGTNTGEAALNMSVQLLFTNLDILDIHDSFRTDIYIHIPTDALAGVKSDIITFTGVTAA